MKNLVLYKTGESNKSNAFKPARIDVESYEKLEDLKQQTGLPIWKLTSICIDFAYQNVVIKDGVEVERSDVN